MVIEQQRPLTTQMVKQIVKSFFQALLNIKTMKIVREYDRWAFLCEKKKMQTDVTEALTESLDNDDLAAVFSVLLEDVANPRPALYTYPAASEPLIAQPENEKGKTPP
nr:uncharacterized protein LOC109173786 [Ipomoea batatas]